MGSPQQLPRRKMTTAHKAGRQEAFSGGNEHKIQHQLQKKVKTSVRRTDKFHFVGFLSHLCETLFISPYIFFQESIPKSSSSCSLGSYLSMVDPWYNSNIRSLGYMIPEMVGKPHSGAKTHKETEPGL